MSNTLYGSPTAIEKARELASITNGIPPYDAELPITVPSIRGQRASKISTINKWLKDESGFNWSLWRDPSVVKVPEQKARAYQSKMLQNGSKIGGQKKFIDIATSMEPGFLGDGFWYGRWDGDHRAHIWKLAFPHSTSMKFKVYPVDSVEVANELFVKIQKFNQKGLNSEDTFVNQYLYMDDDALNLATKLEYCGLCVKNSKDETVPEDATQHTPSTQIRLFKESLKEAGLEETKLAAKVLTSALSRNKKWNREISSTVLKGLAIVFKVRDKTMKNGLHQALVQYVSDCIKTTPRQQDLVKFWAQAAGHTHMKESRCMAAGLIYGLRTAITCGTYGSGPHIADPLKVNDVIRDLGLPEIQTIKE